MCMHVKLQNVFFSGFFCIRYPKFLLEEGARELYQRILLPTNASVRLKFQVKFCSKILYLSDHTNLNF